jgi:hypothetical protein
VEEEAEGVRAAEAEREEEADPEAFSAQEPETRSRMREYGNEVHQE